MKKISVCVAVFLCAFSLMSSAQFKKGTVMLGTTVGSTSYSNNHSDYAYENGSLRSTQSHPYSLSVGPQVGLFLSPQLLAGASLNASFTSNHTTTNNTNAAGVTSTADSKSKSTTLGLSPFVRYYLVALTGKNWPYIQANGGFATGTGNTTGSSVNTNSTSSSKGKVNSIKDWHAGGSVGITHFFFPNIGMDLALGYNYGHNHSNNVSTTTTIRKSSSQETTNTNTYVLNTRTNGVSLSVGFHWFL